MRVAQHPMVSPPVDKDYWLMLVCILKKLSKVDLLQFHYLRFCVAKDDAIFTMHDTFISRRQLQC